MRGFRDATYTSPSFWLSIRDVVTGVRCARDAGWFTVAGFDLDEYDLWDQSLSGYVHQVLCRQRPSPAPRGHPTAFPALPRVPHWPPARPCRGATVLPGVPEAARAQGTG